MILFRYYRFVRCSLLYLTQPRSVWPGSESGSTLFPVLRLSPLLRAFYFIAHYRLPHKLVVSLLSRPQAKTADIWCAKFIESNKHQRM